MSPAGLQDPFGIRLCEWDPPGDRRRSAAFQGGAGTLGANPVGLSRRLRAIGFNVQPILHPAAGARSVG